MNRVEMGLRAMADRFAFFSLLSPWNDTMKRISAVVTTQRILHFSEAWVRGEATPRMIEELAFMKIDYKIAREIVRQIEGAMRHKSLIIPNTAKWTNREARDAFRLALGVEVDRTIITPMVGDVPLVMNTEAGRVIGQFKRFGMASTKVILLSNLQWRDKQAMNGAILAFAMGAAVAKFKAEQYGYGIGSESELALQAIDRSGLIGIFPDINKSISQASRGTIAPGNMIFGGHNRFKYSDRDITDVLMGPTRGTIRNIMKAGSGTAKVLSGNPHEIKESEIRAHLRLTPLYNLFYLTNTLENMIVKPINRKAMRLRREKKAERQERYEQRQRRRRRNTKAENQAILDGGDYTFMEMEFEDRGTDGMLDFLKERYQIVQGKPLSIHPALRQGLRANFKEENLAALKRSSDKAGVQGMLDYLNDHARGMA
jgi:hypothetical protein